MNNNNEEYHFYDVDDNLEDKGLLADIPEDYSDEEPKKASTAFIAGALGLLTVMAIAIMTWILFHKRYGNILMSHGIMATLALLFCALGLLWAMSARKGITFNKQPSPMMTLIVYIGSILFGAYFLVSSLYLWVYRYFFRNYTQSTHAIPEKWDKHFWDQSISKALTTDKRLLFSIVILGLLAAVCFGLLAWAAYGFLGSNQVQTKKITLMLALIAIAVFAFLVLIWYLNHKDRWSVIKEKFKEIGSFNMFKFFFIIAIIAISLAFLNALLNFIGSVQSPESAKSYNFVFGWIWLVLFCICLVCTAVFFRDIYQISRDRPYSCNKVADFVEEDEYDGWSGFCNGKYLKAGQTCRKTDLY